MKKTIIPAVVTVLIVGVSLFLIFRNKSTSSDVSVSIPVPAAAASAMHKVTVNEVKQAGEYTYMNVTEGNRTYWIAAIRQAATKGDTYYFGEALGMSDFQSKELDTVFSSVYFVNQLLTNPAQGNTVVEMPAVNTKNPNNYRDDISITPPDGAISIADLFKNHKSYNGKKVTVKGQVVKVNLSVMGKNWVHIQDGTKDGESFDLTITTQETVKVDEVLTFEGTIALDRDFGAGYVYDVIMEDAVKR